MWVLKKGKEKHLGIVKWDCGWGSFPRKDANSYLLEEKDALRIILQVDGLACGVPAINIIDIFYHKINKGLSRKAVMLETSVKKAYGQKWMGLFLLP